MNFEKEEARRATGGSTRTLLSGFPKSSCMYHFRPLKISSPGCKTSSLGIPRLRTSLRMTKHFKWSNGRRRSIHCAADLGRSDGLTATRESERRTVFYFWWKYFSDSSCERKPASMQNDMILVFALVAFVRISAALIRRGVNEMPSTRAQLPITIRAAFLRISSPWGPRLDSF